MDFSTKDIAKENVVDQKLLRYIVKIIKIKYFNAID